MGNSHFRSDVIALDHTQSIKGFREVKCATLTATDIVVNTSLTAPSLGITGNASANVLKASGLGDSSYIQIGANNQYLFVGPSNTEASVVLEATALVGATIKGSLYLGRKGQAWFMTSDTAASPVGMD